MVNGETRPTTVSLATSMKGTKLNRLRQSLKFSRHIRYHE